MDAFKGKRLVIAAAATVPSIGPLPSAIAESVTLVHRRDEFRAAPDSVGKMRGLVSEGAMDLNKCNITGVNGSDGQISSCHAEEEGKDPYELPCDALLGFYGLTMKLGPVADFGMCL
jgi:thioredoxin reductase (NADPH)